MVTTTMRGGDPVDHLLVLRHEHVVGGLLDDEGDGAGGRRGKQHGEAREHQQPEARAQMLPPDAHDDFARGVVVGLEVVGTAPPGQSRVAEQLIFQALPRSRR